MEGALEVDGAEGCTTFKMSIPLKNGQDDNFLFCIVYHNFKNGGGGPHPLDWRERQHSGADRTSGSRHSSPTPAAATGHGTGMPQKLPWGQEVWPWKEENISSHSKLPT